MLYYFFSSLYFLSFLIKVLSDYDSVILDYLYWEEMKVYYADITVNEALKNSISIVDIEPCFDF